MLSLRWIRALNVTPQPTNRPTGRSRSQPSEAGLTILEPLMALIVVAILLITTAPMITLSVAARIRARQVELATQAGRSYIDNLRSGAIDPPSTINDTISPPRSVVINDFRVPNTCANQYRNNQAPGDACVQFDVAQVNAPGFMRPTFTANDLDPNIAGVDQGVLIDGNGDNAYRGVVDFRIQAIRTRIPGETGTPLNAERVRANGYSVIVRVYQANVDLNVPLETVPPVGSPFTAAVRSGVRQRPLVVLRSDVVGLRGSSEFRNQNTNLYRP